MVFCNTIQWQYSYTNTIPYWRGTQSRGKCWRVSLKTNNFNDKVVLYLAKIMTMVGPKSTQNSLVFIREEIPVIRDNCKQFDKWYFWFDEAAECWICPKHPIWTKICLIWDIDLTNDVYPNNYVLGSCPKSRWSLALATTNENWEVIPAIVS